MINIALLGFGTVGSGVAEVLAENAAIIEKRLGKKINVKYILDLRDFPDSPFADKIVHDFNVILKDPEIEIVAEMMGGSHPAYDFSKAALEAGKSVVTSNKECVANFGVELLQVAEKNGVRYLFEASVGGGIPVIRPIINDLAPVRIKSISGILNGTTNYILSKMAKEKAAFGDVLADAQKKGYAEANPAADVEGIDAARKIVILAALASDKLENPDTIHREGITKVTELDMKIADAFGCVIKLIAHFENRNGKLLSMVSPRFVSKNSPLGTVSDVFNGILIDTDMLGEVMFYGHGAGKLPTAGAVCADIFDIAAGVEKVKKVSWTSAKADDIANFDEYACKRVVTVKASQNDLAAIEMHFGKSEKTVCVDNTVSFIINASEKDSAALVATSPLEVTKTYRML